MTYKFKEYEPSEVLRNHLDLGGANPEGERIDVTSLYIERGGKPVIPVMGEYHFSRDSRDRWPAELRKLCAGGMTLVATYLFMIYHEEDEGVYDFSGDLDIRKFVLDAKDAGLDVVLRIGPWAHGECRNGGFPDWLMQKPFKLRDNNEEYMAIAREWYEKIYEQVKGLFYKDGGNIIAVQIENELVDRADHLLALKRLAQEIGYDVPIWTVTGWNSKYGAKIPADDVLPVFGAYPEAPWTGHIRPLPPSPHYVFNTMRNDSAIGNDQIGAADADGWRLPYERYPFATCEIGGGIECTHHRRPLIRPMDIYALSLVKLGSGNNLIGYYMYHGGINKIGKHSTFNESKASGYPNDCAVISYDFQAPVSEYGELREHYALLNKLHLFVEDFGDILAPMESVLSENEVEPKDKESLRYCMRTNGKSGFVFVNNYQRLMELDEKKDVVIDTGSVVFPSIDVKSGVSFILPFNIPVGSKTLEYATAQLICRDGNTYYFESIDGIEPRFKFSGSDAFCVPEVVEFDDVKIVVVSPKESEMIVRADGEVRIVSLDDVYALTGSDRHTDTAAAFTDCEPMALKYGDELRFGGIRRLTFKRVEAESAEGFIEIPFECDVSQLYVDGELAADNFYYGKPWRVPASLVYGRDAVLVYSEMRNDFYREF